ncbi:MAG TPA: 2-phosphosulfolactate phosphatase [Roseimicrobium sp.]|nr:2-phosphosulfolactate phosphatase [Roseimicrobium sp.]
MKRSIEVLFSPAEYSALRREDLRGTVCVVFDVLRATTSMMTALDAGAESIFPVREILMALELKKGMPDALLAGEREGLRIGADLTGGVEFDLGNSPREFTPSRVQGRRIIMTTTNGTRALQSCVGADAIWIGSFLNLRYLSGELLKQPADRWLLVCAGTLEEASMEDTLGAGALAELLVQGSPDLRIADSVQIAIETYRKHSDDLPGAMKLARNGRRLLSIPELAGDIPVCLQRDMLRFAAKLGTDGRVTRVG